MTNQKQQKRTCGECEFGRRRPPESNWIECPVTYRSLKSSTECISPDHPIWAVLQRAEEAERDKWIAERAIEMFMNGGIELPREYSVYDSDLYMSLCYATAEDEWNEL